MKNNKVYLIYPPSPVMNREDRCQQPTDDLIVIPPLPPTDLLYLASIARQKGFEPIVRDYSFFGENLEKLEQDLESTKENIKVEMEAIEKDRMKVCDKKAKLVDDINQKVLTFYQKIRKWAKNTAVVPVKKQACYGCFMKIYDKTYLSILKGEEIVTCPHCGRILYKESEEEAIN